MNRHLNTFDGGMKQDLDNQTAAKNTYLYSLNGKVIFNVEQGTYSWENAKGNKRVFTLLVEYNRTPVPKYKPIGFCELNGKLIVLSTNNTFSEIGFVTQDTQLFAGTIKENLLFVNPRASDAEITDVLLKASCMNLLARSDNGINTVIGEGGMKVSGGEKQRLSIARALLRNPNLLVFDEATSALDSITEEEISNTIRTISQKKNHITVMIAHRLSTILHADRIYVLEKGEIVETGKHETLIAEKGLYYAMWRQQIGERKEEG